MTIDNVDRNHNLGMIFEAAALKGKLFVCMCSLDKLGSNAADCLLTSIRAYMDSSRFMPETEIAEKKLRIMFTK
jgi:hypothetical protein